MVEIEAPECLLRPLVIPNKLMMGPGPSNSSPRVLHAMGYPILGHLHTETLQIMDEVKLGIRYIFQTNNALTLCVSGTGHAGMEAALDNILEPGNVALFPTNGIWGSRAADMASRCGAMAIKLEGTPGKSFSLSELESGIKQYRPHVLFITQGESSTGVLQPLEGLGDICHNNITSKNSTHKTDSQLVPTLQKSLDFVDLGRKLAVSDRFRDLGRKRSAYKCILLVDTVASLGGTPFYMDKWGIDVVYTGSQKVLGVPPGITPISFSPLAQRRIFERTTPVSVYYWDMKLLGEYWGCYDGKPRIYHHTIPVNLLYGLREGLAQICEETLPKCIARHQKCAEQLHDGLRQLGLQLYVEQNGDRLPTVTAVKVPEKLDWKKVISFAMDRYYLEISGGLGPTVGQIFRIGVMGYNATPKNVERTLNVLLEGINKTKISNSKL